MPAVVLGPDGLSRFEELRSREAGHAAMLHAFDPIEHDGGDMRNCPFLGRKARSPLLHDTEADIRFNEHIAEDDPIVFACRLGARGHRAEEGRWYLSGCPVPRLDQGAQSRQHRRAAGEKRAVEAMSHLAAGVAS
jgi:ATP-dependent DNA ligase